MTKTPQVSVVIPVLNEEKNVAELCARIAETLRSLAKTYEILFVDDVSRDGTIAELERLRGVDQNIKIVQFSRRFGYQNSIFAGLELATGDVVITMDSDLQHPPELIGAMLAKHAEGFDVVNMARDGVIQNTMLHAIGSKIFYRLINSLSQTPLTQNSADFRLYDRCVVEVLRQLPEKSLFLRGLVGWLGFRQAVLPFKEAQRQHGASEFNFKQSLRLAIEAICSFSAAPLYLAAYFGAFVSLCSLLYGLYVAARYLTNTGYPAGWPTLICINLFIGGTQMLFMGVLGVYIAKIFSEVKGRPRYIIARTVGLEPSLKTRLP